MSLTGTRKWFTAIPMGYVETDPAFWYRDVGALCRAFRNLGIDSRLVAWGTPAVREDVPLILCRPEQMQDPVWWRQWNLEGVVVTSWGAPKFEPHVRAIKESGAKLVVRLDSDGIVSPHVHFGRFFSRTYFGARDARRSLPLVYALAKSLLYRFISPIYERRVSRHLRHADIIIIESPIAKQCLVRLFRKMGWSELVDRLRVLPHPALAEITFNPSVAKQPKILAVGRWDATQKNAPTLIRALGKALAFYPRHSATLLGSGDERLKTLCQLLPPEVRQRIRVLGRVDHLEVHQHYLDSQVLVFSSRYEGFPFTASEALCCGCTVVGPATLPSLNYLASMGGGTVAMSSSPQEIADALGAELDVWESGGRDPGEISRFWIPRISMKAAATRVLEFFPQR